MKMLVKLAIHFSINCYYVLKWNQRLKFIKFLWNHLKWNKSQTNVTVNDYKGLLQSFIFALTNNSDAFR